MALSEGIEHYYPLDSDIADDVGSEDLHSVGSGAYVTGKLGNAFDNQNAAHLRQSMSGSGDFTMSGDPEDGVTIDCWFNMQTALSGSRYVFDLLPVVSSTGPGRIFLFWDASNLRFVSGMKDNGFVSRYAYGEPYVSAPTSQWVYLAAWYDLTYIGLRVDDVETLGVHGGLTGATGTWPYFYVLNEENESSTTRPDAIIDDLALWNRTLTASERDTRYNGGIGLAYPFPTPGKPNVIWF